MPKKDCICFEGDARTCWELTHYGYSPVSRMSVLDDPGRRPTDDEILDALDEDSEECECACHRQEEDDGR